MQVYEGYILHVGSMKNGDLKIGDEVKASYDKVGTYPRQIRGGSMACS